VPNMFDSQGSESPRFNLVEVTDWRSAGASSRGGV
jgi:hypothetical protein